MSIKEQLKQYLKIYTYRGLPKRETKLWEEIIQATNFLPEDVKPAQRCWHILNESYEIKLCPIDNIPVRWWGSHYSKYSSNSAKARDPEHTKLRMQTYQERTGERHWYAKENPDREEQLIKQKERDYSKYTSPFSKKEVQEKRKETWMKKYGVDNPFKAEKVIEKISQVNKESGKWYNYDTKKAEYNATVCELTNSQYYKHFHDIPNADKRSNEWYLDHIFSISEGYNQDIPPEIISHYTNLQILSRYDNSSKGAKCGKTKEKLFEDYERVNY